MQKWVENPTATTAINNSNGGNTQNNNSTLFPVGLLWCSWPSRSCGPPSGTRSKWNLVVRSSALCRGWWNLACTQMKSDVKVAFAKVEI